MDGTKTGIITGLGIATGDFIHVLLATIGISAILMTSTAAFNIVKIAGAAYLLYMGIQALLAKATSVRMPDVVKESLFKAYKHGILVEALNPKTALFFLALFPQFVDVERGKIVTQFLILGVIFVVLAVIYTTILSIFTGKIGQLLKAGNGMNKWGNKVLGLIYIGSKFASITHWTISFFINYVTLQKISVTDFITYIPRYFQNTNFDEIMKLIEKNSFATIVTSSSHQIKLMK